MRYFLGVDGGGTKTHVLFYDAVESTFDLISGAATNYENMPNGYADLAIVLADMIKPFLARYGLVPSDIHSAAFGMSGVDTKKQNQEISKVIASLGFANFVLDNDAALGIKAGTSKGVGISCVNGSGFNVIGMGANGESLLVGGMGIHTGDYGGGYWFVPEAIRYVHGELFRRYPKSVMTTKLMGLLGITCKFDLMEELHAQYFNGDQKSFALAVCKIIFSSAEEGDAAAIGLLQMSGQAYGESILGILDNMEFDSPPEIVLTGSLFQKYPKSAIIAKLCAFLKENYGKPFTTHALDTPSVLGALFWAMGDVTAEKRAELRALMDAAA